jgi:hypothetical protein
VQVDEAQLPVLLTSQSLLCVSHCCWPNIHRIVRNRACRACALSVDLHPVIVLLLHMCAVQLPAFGKELDYATASAAAAAVVSCALSDSDPAVCVIRLLLSCTAADACPLGSSSAQQESS